MCVFIEVKNEYIFSIQHIHQLKKTNKWLFAVLWRENKLWLQFQKLMDTSYHIVNLEKN